LVQVISTNRDAALIAFRKMGDQATPVLLHAFEKVDRPWDKFWQWAYPKLPALMRARLSPPVPAWITRGAAWIVFFESPKLEKNAFPELLRHLEDKHKSDQAHSYVMGLLIRIVRQDSTNALPVVIPYLRANDPDLRRGAAMVLRQIGPSAKAAMPGLYASLNDPDVGVRINSALAILTIDQQTNVATAVLEKELASMAVGDLFVSTAMCLREVSPDSPVLLPAYIKALQAPKTTYRAGNDYFRSDFIERLAKYGRAVEAAVPLLVRIIREESSLRSTALQTLRQIDPDEAKKWETEAPSSQ